MGLDELKGCGEEKVAGEMTLPNREMEMLGES
jgi:hypothetical protein